MNNAEYMKGKTTKTKLKNAGMNDGPKRKNESTDERANRLAAWKIYLKPTFNI